MPAGQSQTPERRGVGAQLVGDQQFWRDTLLFEQLAHQPQRRAGVALALDQLAAIVFAKQSRRHCQINFCGGEGSTRRNR